MIKILYLYPASLTQACQTSYIPSPSLAGLLGKLSSMGAKAGQARVLPISAAPSPRTSGDGAAPPQQQQPFPMDPYQQLPSGGPQAFAASNAAMGRPPMPRTGRSSDPGHSISPLRSDMDRGQANSTSPSRYLPEHAAVPPLATQRRRSTAGDAALPPPAPVLGQAPTNADAVQYIPASMELERDLINGQRPLQKVSSSEGLFSGGVQGLF